MNYTFDVQSYGPGVQPSLRWGPFAAFLSYTNSAPVHPSQAWHTELTLRSHSVPKEESTQT